MPAHADIDVRMKTYYEQIPKTRLMRRTPVAIRIDGKAFHTFSKGFNEPFDQCLMTAMQETMKYLCENIQGCVFGYTQSDEISLILVDYQTFRTAAWFDYEVQKMCSIGASMATMQFNRSFAAQVEEFRSLHEFADDWTSDLSILNHHYEAALQRGAMFDCRCFNIPKEEVTNLIYSRQIDASRNSVQMVGHTYFTDSELHRKNVSMIQDMLHEQVGINWNDLPIPQKRGTACLKVNGKWTLDFEMPILKGEDRAYIDDLINVGEV